MRRLLLILITSLAFPISASAEAWWLLVKHGEGLAGRSYSWRIPTNSESECNKEKIKVVKAENWEGWKNASNQTISAICIKGK